MNETINCFHLTKKVISEISNQKCWLVGKRSRIFRNLDIFLMENQKDLKDKGVSFLSSLPMVIAKLSAKVDQADLDQSHGLTIYTACGCCLY